MRSGTRSECKEKWTAKGQRPICKVKLGYEYCYLYAALNPYSGHLFSLILPDMTKESFAVFNEHFCRHLNTLHPTGPKPQVLLIADGAGAHQSHICQACGITLQTIPPASPELNPVERFFQELRKDLANIIFDTLEAVENHLAQVLKTYYEQPPRIISLCQYPYLVPKPN